MDTKTYPVTHSEADWRKILTPEQFHNFDAAATDCYCFRGVDRCDFCTSMRTPDGAPSSNGSAFA